MRKCIAVIPARGGSKGIPRKNLAVVGGLPLVAWSILHAKQAECVGAVLVTTDDEEIGRMAQQFGATWITRSPELSDDKATTEAAVVDALEGPYGRVAKHVVLNHSGHECEWVLTLQPTSPLRSPRVLDTAWNYLQENQDNLDALFSARVVDGYCWHVDGETLTRIGTPRQMRQARSEKTVEENGSFYFTRIATLRETEDRLGGRSTYYPMDPLDSFQIDEPSDLARMELLMHVRLPQLAAQRSLGVA